MLCLRLGAMPEGLVIAQTACYKLSEFCVIIQGQSRVLFPCCMDSQGLDVIPAHGRYWA